MKKRKISILLAVVLAGAGLMGCADNTDIAVKETSQIFEPIDANDIANALNTSNTSNTTIASDTSNATESINTADTTNTTNTTETADTYTDDTAVIKEILE